MRSDLVLGLVLGLLIALALLPSAFGKMNYVNLSDTEIQPGENITFEGRADLIRCSSGDFFIRVLLKHPSGRYAVTPLSIDFVSVRDDYCYTTPHGEECEIRYNFSGTLRTTGEWVQGDYQIIVDAPYRCYDDPENPAHGDRVVTGQFKILGPNNTVLDYNWTWNTKLKTNWWNTSYNDSNWYKGEAPFGNTDQYDDAKTFWEGRHIPPNGGLVPEGDPDGYFRKKISANKFTPLAFDLEYETSAECYFNNVKIFDGLSSDGVRPGHCDDYAETDTYYLRGNTYNVNCQSDNQNLYQTEINLVSGTNVIACDIRTLDDMYRLNLGNGLIQLPGKAWFNPKISFYGPDEIKWVNKLYGGWNKLNVSAGFWYAGELPITDDQPFLDTPYYYDSGGSINRGVKPWKESVSYFRKWVGYNESENWMIIASTTVPTCYINEQQINITENEHEYWVFKANVSGKTHPGANLVACSVPSNGYFNYFDFLFVEEVPEVVPVPIVVSETRVGFVPQSGQSDQDASSGQNLKIGLTLLGGLAAAGVAGFYLKTKGSPTDYLARMQRAVNNLNDYMDIDITKPMPGLSPRNSFFAKVKAMGDAYQEKVAMWDAKDKEWEDALKNAKKLKAERLARESPVLVQNFLATLSGMTTSQMADAILKFLEDNQNNLTEEDKSMLYQMRNQLRLAPTAGSNDSTGQDIYQYIEGNQNNNPSFSAINGIIGILQGTANVLNDTWTWVKEHPAETVAIIAALVAFIALLIFFPPAALALAGFLGTPITVGGITLTIGLAIEIAMAAGAGWSIGQAFAACGYDINSQSCDEKGKDAGEWIVMYVAGEAVFKIAGVAFKGIKSLEAAKGLKAAGYADEEIAVALERFKALGYTDDEINVIAQGGDDIVRLRLSLPKERADRILLDKRFAGYVIDASDTGSALKVGVHDNKLYINPSELAKLSDNAFEFALAHEAAELTKESMRANGRILSRTKIKELLTTTGLSKNNINKAVELIDEGLIPDQIALSENPELVNGWKDSAKDFLSGLDNYNKNSPIPEEELIRLAYIKALNPDSAIVSKVDDVVANFAPEFREKFELVLLVMRQVIVDV